MGIGIIDSCVCDQFDATGIVHSCRRAYAIFGGLKAIAASYALNGVGLVLGGILVSYFGLKFLGDGNVAEGWSHIVANHSESLTVWGKPSDTVQ